MRSRFWGSAFYFTYFSATGAIYPYLSLYYQQSGNSMEQIGVLVAVSTITGLWATPLWGLFADGMRLHRYLLPITMGLTAPAVLMLWAAHGFPLQLTAVLLYAFCLAPIISLGDFAVLHALGDRRYEYGQVRLWGAVGWGLSAWFFGNLIEKVGLSAGFVGFVALILIGALVATRLPAPRIEAQTGVKQGLAVMARDRRWYFFLGGTALAGMALAVHHNYFILFFNQMGGKEGLFGFSVVLASVSEVIFFLLTPKMLRSWGPRGVLLFSCGSMALRMGLTSMMRLPFWALPLQLFHGPSFSAMWSAGVNYTREISPEGLGASTQSIYSTVFFNLAGALGALLGSLVIARFGMAAMFAAAALFTVIGGVLIGMGDLSARKKANAG